MTSINDPNRSDRPRTRQRGWYWPLIIVGMLLVHASLIVGTIIYVGGKRDTYVDPDYYAKAIDWDNQREMKELAEKKGWDVSISAIPVGDDQAQRVISVTLTDQQGAAIDDAIVHVVCFNPNEMSNRVSQELDRQGRGVYEHKMPIERPGIWSCSITIQRFGETALIDTEFDVLTPTAEQHDGGTADE